MGKQSKRKETWPLPMVQYHGAQSWETNAIFITTGGEVAEVTRRPKLRWKKVKASHYVSTRGRWTVVRVATTVSMRKSPDSWLLTDTESGGFALADSCGEAKELAQLVSAYDGSAPFMHILRAWIQRRSGEHVKGWVLYDSRSGAWAHFVGQGERLSAEAVARRYGARAVMEGPCVCEVCLEWGPSGRSKEREKRKRPRDAKGRFKRKE